MHTKASIALSQSVIWGCILFLLTLFPLTGWYRTGCQQHLNTAVATILSSIICFWVSSATSRCILCRNTRRVSCWLCSRRCNACTNMFQEDILEPREVIEMVLRNKIPRVTVYCPSCDALSVRQRALRTERAILNCEWEDLPRFKCNFAHILPTRVNDLLTFMELIEFLCDTMSSTWRPTDPQQKWYTEEKNFRGVENKPFIQRAFEYIKETTQIHRISLRVHELTYSTTMLSVQYCAFGPYNEIDYLMREPQDDVIDVESDSGMSD